MYKIKMELIEYNDNKHTITSPSHFKQSKGVGDKFLKKIVLLYFVRYIFKLNSPCIYFHHSIAK